MNRLSCCQVFAIIALFLVAFLQPSNSQAGDLQEAKVLNQKVIRLYRQGRYASAIPLAVRELAIREKVLGPEHPDVARSLTNLAALYYRLGDYRRAEPLFRRALTIEEKAFGAEHTSTVDSLNNLATLYKDIGHYNKALPLFKRALAIREKGLGAEHPDTVKSLDNLASLYERTGDYDKAQPLYERALAIRERVLGPEHPDVATSLNSLALLFEHLREYRRAERFYVRSRAILEKAFGPRHPDVAIIVYNLAKVYEHIGDYGKAETLNKRALEIFEKSLGPEHPLIISGLNNLAALYLHLGDYRRAEPLFRRALAMSEKVFGAEHPDTAGSLNNLASLYERTGDYDKAQPLYERALAIRERVLGPEHPDVARSLNNRASLYEIQGDYRRAELLFRRALTIREKVLGAEHPDTASSLDNLASLYGRTGDYTKALPLSRRALAIREEVLGAGHIDTAGSLNNLAALYKDLGDYGKAELFYTKALAINEKYLGPKHSKVASVLNNLAVIYQFYGDYGKAETLLKRAQAIWVDIFGPEHPVIAKNLINLINNYEAVGDYVKAERLYKRVLAINEKAFGEEHPETAASLSDLASHYYYLGDYDKALPLSRRALAIREKVLGAEHPDTATSLNNLATYYAATGAYEEAYNLFLKAQAISSSLIINQVMGFPTEEQKIKFLLRKHGEIAAFLGFINEHMRQNPSVFKDALDIWLKRKGLLLEANKHFQAALVNSDDPKAVEVFQELMMVRAQLSKLTYSGPSNQEDLEIFKKKKAYFETKKERLEAKLSQLNQAFVINQEIAKADCEKVARALPADTVLLDFARVEIYDFKVKGRERKWKPAHYLAFILHAGKRNSARMIDLGDAGKIDDAVARFKEEISISKGTKGTRIINSSREIHSLVFEPLITELGNVKEIYVSPDGYLSLIPFEVLQAPDGRYLIEDYRFNYLATGRDVLAFGKMESKGKKILLMGDPDFDMETEEKNFTLRKLALTKEAHRVLNKRSSDMRGLHFSRLPGTGEEVKAIQALLGETKAQVYTDKEALEEVLWQKGTPKILHLATHGFFLSDPDFDDFEEDIMSRGIHLVRLPKKQGKKAKIKSLLLRTGIALAAANNTLSVQNTGISDGIVTAEKVLGLRLRGTDMVVLSACETGLGKVMLGEGVFGLGRAFTQAGAKSLVMSMWKVPDLETKELMIEFYRNIMSGSMNRCKGLRLAALKQMKIVEARYGHTNPLYWGAFVFMGEP